MSATDSRVKKGLVSGLVGYSSLELTLRSVFWNIDPPRNQYMTLFDGPSNSADIGFSAYARIELYLYSA